MLPDSEIYAVLRQFNPWWSDSRSQELPAWRRAAYRELWGWLVEPPARRALLLSGARQVGKTTLFLQAIDGLLDKGINNANIIYASFDHPMLKLAGPDELLRIWQEYEPPGAGPTYLFLDEIQMARNWQTWVKHQVDFGRHRIAMTGSATPLTRDQQESGVGRWVTVRLATLSFYEYLQITDQAVKGLPDMPSLLPLYGWNPARFVRTAQQAQPLAGLFHDYLLRGGFPECAQVRNIATAQRLMREDIVDKVLKRDMTALFGVRHVLELEQVFLYLCLHDGGILNIQSMASSLGLKRPTVASFIDLLEATHLIYRLMPFGYGKEVLRGRPKVYLADPAIAPSVLLKGKTLLENPTALGAAVETAFFKHVFARFYRQSIGFSYYSGKNQQEIDIIADLEGTHVPFEVKYRDQPFRKSDLKGLIEFCTRRGIRRGYLITRKLEDFGPVDTGVDGLSLLRVPAAMACYWLGQSELQVGTGL